MRLSGVKKCRVCNEIKPLSDFHKSRRYKDGHRNICKTCRSNYDKKWREENKERHLAYKRNYYSKHKNKYNKWSREYRKNNPEKVRKWAIISNQRRRLKVLIHYGGNPPKCAWCGMEDIRVLTIDHIHGGGHQHRKQIGCEIFLWLIKNDYPEGYQVLCRNCNWRKRLDNK